MRQKSLLKSLLLLCLLVVGVSNAWADEVQLSEGVHDGSAITWTLSDGSTTAVTIKQMKGAGAAVSANYISAPRVYRANLLSFEAASGYAITNISITYSGNYKGTTITSGTELSGNDVTSNTTDITQTLSTESNGTHTFASSSSSGLSAIYIQNGTTSATNTQLRPTKIDVTFVSSGGSGTQTVATPYISGNESFVNSTEVTISCSTDGAAIQYSTNNGTSWSTYSAPFTLTETTTVQAKATKTGMTESAVASKTFTKITPLANIAALTANTENGTYYVTLNNAVVTFVSDNYAYIQDASGAVAMYKSGHGLTAGDVLNGTATVAYQLRNGNPQITDLSGVTPVSGTAPDPTSVAASAWSYTFNNVLSQYFQITGATITQSNNKYYISLGGESVQLYKVGTALSSLDLTRTYTITGFPTLYNTTKELQIFDAPVAEATSEPTITVAPATLTGFTYEVGSGPSDPQTITVSGANLTADITVALGQNSNFEISTAEGSGYANSLTLPQNNGEVASTTIYVRLKADLAANSYSDDISLNSTSATEKTVSLSGSVTAAAAPHVTWDLSTDQTATATTTEMSWTSTYATMLVEKGSSTTNTNNYYPGSDDRTSTRFYNGSELTISPASGYAITSVVFTATSTNYANALGNSTWTNATASVDGTNVTVTPTDGTVDIEAAIGGTCGFTGVTVYYESSNVVNYTITLATVTNGSIASDKSKAQAGQTVTLTATPDTNYSLDSWTVVDANNGAVTVTVSPTDANEATFTMPASNVTVSATFTTSLQSYNVTIASGIENGTVTPDKQTALEGETVTLTIAPSDGYILNSLTVTAGNDNVETTKTSSTTYTFTMPASNVTVTATFAQFTAVTYTLATAIEPGKHYIITNSATVGTAVAMGLQNTNNRAGVVDAVTISNNGTTTTASVTGNDVHEFLICGPNADGNYTIYDESTENEGKDHGYLYAASSGSNYLKTHSSVDGNALWDISIDSSDGKATIIAQGTNSRNEMRYNSSNTLFSCYTGGQQSVYLYVKNGEAAATRSFEIKSGFTATTFSADCAVDFTNSGATAYIITDGTGHTVEVTKVPARTGVYVEGNANTYTLNVTTEYTNTGVDMGDNKLEAVMADHKYYPTTDVTYYAHGKKNNHEAFYKVSDNGLTVAAGKAVLAVPATQAGAKEFIDVNGGATSIDNLTPTLSEGEGAVYDLSGRKMNGKLMKGIYIVNGKKVVIK